MDAIRVLKYTYNNKGQEDGWIPEYYSPTGEYLGSPGVCRDYGSPNNHGAVVGSMNLFEKQEELNVIKEEHQREAVFSYRGEVVEKRVSTGGNSGRVYVPPEWVGHRVAVIRLD